MSDRPLLEVTSLVKHFPSPAGLVKAVDGVSFAVGKGETLGIVGESGCGKTTVGNVILRLDKPTSGSVSCEGRDIGTLSKAEMIAFRKKEQIIFQDPFASLNPRMRVGDIVGEPMIVHSLASKRELREKTLDLLAVVGLDPSHASRYPHEFSGGQRQRVGIARALAVQPELIVCDEPVSALDVSIQAQIINLLKDLQTSRGLTYLFISHDLSVVKHISDRVLVMYLGKVMELADKRDLFASPLHPYTVALLSSVPVPDPDKQGERVILQGDTPSPVDPPRGCRFHTRCPRAFERCRIEAPELRDLGGGHLCACHAVAG